MAEATKRDDILGVRLLTTGDEAEDVAPWTRLPSGKPRTHAITPGVPVSLNVVLAQRVFVETAALPSAFINDVKRLAAFQNPEFYKKQRMRLSTSGTPRVIACAEQFPNHVVLPRACLHDLEALLRDHGASLSVDDQRSRGVLLDVDFKGELTELQRKALEAIKGCETGVVVAPPGSGKTVLGARIIAERRCSTLVLVHRQPLVDQWVAQLSAFLGTGARDIGRIVGGRRKPNGRLDVATIQSLTRAGRVDDLVASYGQVIVDECHHVPAGSFERVLSEVRANYIVGLTATPERRDGHHPIMEMQLGPIRFTASSAKEDSRSRSIVHRLIVRTTRFTASDANLGGIQAIYGAIATDACRNGAIVADVVAALDEGRVPLVLTERTEHLDVLAAELDRRADHVVVLKGGRTAARRIEVERSLAEIPPNTRSLLIATGRYIGEGFDHAPLDTLFLAMPVSWKGTLVQYVGRLHRQHPNKREVRIYDYVDREVPMLARMFEKRRRGYRAMGYAENALL